MTQDDAITTLKCPSCGADVPVAALLCPKCGRPNVSSEFASPGSSLFGPPAQTPPPVEEAIVPPPIETAPPTETASPTEAASQEMQPARVPLPVAAPPATLPQPAPQQPAPKLRSSHVPVDGNVVVGQLQDDLDRLDQEWANFASDYYVRRPRGNIAPPDTKEDIGIMIGSGVLFLFGWLVLAAGSQVAVYVGGAICVIAVLGGVVGLLEYSRAYTYQQAYSQYLVKRQKAFTRLRNIGGQAASNAYIAPRYRPQVTTDTWSQASGQTPGDWYTRASLTARYVMDRVNAVLKMWNSD